jgi:hypothetical protein
MCKVPRNRREMATYTPEEIRLVLRAAASNAMSKRQLALS